MVAQLIEKGHAYVVDGEVFYDVRSFPGYGKLSGKRVDELEVGRQRARGGGRRAQAPPGGLHALEAQRAGPAELADRATRTGRRAARAGTSSARR